MNKSRTMRVSALLLALVLITTCFVGGTLAKYVTSGEGSDSARVAKFGVTVTADGATFSNTYTTDDSNYASTYTNSVVGTDSADVVAPGTSGNMTAITLSGTPEVAVKVAYEAEVDLSGWVSDSNNTYYCPITITVNNTVISGLTYSSAEGFASAVEQAIDGYTKSYAAGTDLSQQTNDNLSISWAWAFEGAEGSGQTDEKDTYLGDQAAAGSAATIRIGVTCTVTQID